MTGTAVLSLEGTTWGAPHPPDTRRGATGNRHSRPGESGLGLSRARSSLWPWGCLAARSPPDFWSANVGYLGPADDNDMTRTRSDSGDDSNSVSPNRIGPAAVASGQQDPEARPVPPSRVSRPGCRVRCLDGSGGLPESASLGRPSAGSGMGAGVTGPPRLSRVAPGKDHGARTTDGRLCRCPSACACKRAGPGGRAPREFRRCWERPQGRRDRAPRGAPC